jgi:hypothetical protein
MTVFRRIRPLLIPALFALFGAAGAVNAAPSASAASGKTDFVIPKTTAAHHVDGVLDEPYWKAAGTLDNFRVDADPAKTPRAGTKVKLAYDDTVLLVAFICDEPGLNGKAGESDAQKAAALAGDSCEFSLFSRPETPYYSPYLQRLDYMNANERYRTMRRFALTPAGDRSEARVY